MTHTLSLIKVLDATPTTPRPKRQKPKPRRQRRAEAKANLKAVKLSQKKVG